MGRRELAVLIAMTLLPHAAGVDRSLAQTGEGSPSDSQAEEAELSRRPRLGEHSFVPDPEIGDPFIRTYVVNTLGIGQALDIETVPVIDLTDSLSVGGERGNLIFSVLRLEYQQRLTRWLAVRFGFKLLARLGDGLNTLLAQGVTTNTGYDLEGLVRILETEKVIVSGALGYAKDDFTVINLLDWARGIINDEPVDLVGSRPSDRVEGGLRFAWGVNDWLGLTGSGSGSYGENLTLAQENEWFHSFGLGVDVDLAPRTPVPLGFVLGARQSSFPQGVGDLAKNIQSFIFRVAYTGRDDFVIALDSTVDRLPLREGERLEAGTLRFSMQYYF